MEHNAKMDLKEIEWEQVNGIHGDKNSDIIVCNTFLYVVMSGTSSFF